MAFNVALCPAHIVALFTVTVGFGITVTVEVTVAVQPANVPTMV